MRYSKASREIIEKRQKQMQTFTEFRKKTIEQFELDKEHRLRLRNGKEGRGKGREEGERRVEEGRGRG